MDSYKSNEEIVNYNIETIFDKLSDFENFSKIKEMGNIPPELKSKSTVLNLPVIPFHSRPTL